MKIQPARGTHDLFGQELLKFKKVEKTIRNFANLYNYDEIITPIFESTELFKKPLGENSDVVLKEMYTFSDKNESSLTLRPEFTTPIIRASIYNNFLNKLPQKLYGYGPVFRRERPQKGRYREFNQINFEILGTHDVMSDVELILIADNIIKKLIPEKKVLLHINSLGDANTLNIFKDELKLYFKKIKNNLSNESKNKIDSNPLRILDSKNPEDINFSKDAPKISDFYSKQAETQLNEVKNLLIESKVDFALNQNLVRGLDYYCHTVFEFKSNDLGSQDTLIGGGRYDGLAKVLGGPDIPGVGWAGGIERIMMLMKNENKKEIKICLILMDENCKNYGLSIANEFRKNNINIYFDFKYNLKKSLSTANQNNFEYAVIIGEKEIQNNLCTIKFLHKNTQKTTSIHNIIKKILQ